MYIYFIQRLLESSLVFEVNEDNKVKLLNIAYGFKLLLKYNELRIEYGI